MLSNYISSTLSSYARRLANYSAFYGFPNGKTSPITMVNSDEYIINDIVIKDYNSMLDHYNKNYFNINCGSTVKNFFNRYKTQLEHADKIGLELTKLNPSKKIMVNFQRTSVRNGLRADIPANIGKYIQPLHTLGLDSNQLDIISKLWTNLVQNGKHNTQFLIDIYDEKWVTNIDNYPIECSYPFINKCYQQWVMNTKTTFEYPLQLCLDAHKHTVTDYSLTNKYLLDYRDELYKTDINNYKILFEDTLYKFLNLKNIQEHIYINGYIHINNIIKPFKFDKIYGPHYANILTQIHNILKEDNNKGINLLKNNNDNLQDILTIVSKISSVNYEPYDIYNLLLCLQFVYNHGWTKSLRYILTNENVHLKRVDGVDDSE